MQALHYLVRTLLWLYTLTFLLRFLLQWARADFRNPMSQAIVQITNPLARPARRIIPGWGGIDLSTLLISYLLTVLTIVVGSLILGLPLLRVPALFLSGLLELSEMFLTMVMVIIFGQVILSWIAPYHEVAGFLRTLSSPILRPIQRILPPVAGFDLSPLFALIGIQTLLILIREIR